MLKQLNEQLWQHVESQIAMAQNTSVAIMNLLASSQLYTHLNQLADSQSQLQQQTRACLVVEFEYLIMNADFVKSVLACMPVDFHLVIPWITLVQLEIVSTMPIENSQDGIVFELQLIARDLVQFLAQIQSTKIRRQLPQESFKSTLNNNIDWITDCCLFYRQSVCNAVILMAQTSSARTQLLMDNQIPTVSSELQPQPVWSSSIFVAKLVDKLGFASLQHFLVHVASSCCNILLSHLSRTVYFYSFEAYGRDFNEILAKQSPWSLSDLLQLLKKHWIAIFAEHYRKYSTASSSNSTSSSPSGSGSRHLVEDAARRLDIFYSRWTDKSAQYDSTPISVASCDQPATATTARQFIQLTTCTSVHPRIQPQQPGYMALTAGEVNNVMLDMLTLVPVFWCSSEEKQQIQSQIQQWMSLGRQFLSN